MTTLSAGEAETQKAPFLAEKIYEFLLATRPAYVIFSHHRD